MASAACGPVPAVGRRVALAGALGLAAPGIAAPSGPATLGLTPVFLDSDIVLVRQIEAFLAGQVGRPVQVVRRRTYREVTSLLVAGQLDAAWICGYPFVQHADVLRLLAVPLYQGQPLYRSYLIVQAGRTASDVSALRGDIHAFSDPDSNSGFLVTRAALAAMGVAPTSFFTRTFFTYGHRNVIRAVAAGLAHSGSVDGYVWDVMAEIEPVLTRATRVAWSSEPMGFPPFASSARTDPGLASALAASLLAMSATAGGREILATLRLDGFLPPRPGLYAGIAAMWRDTREEG